MPSNLCKSAHDFGKMTIPWSSTALDRQSPKKFETKEAAMRFHAPSATSAFTALVSRATSPSHAFTRALQRYDVTDDIIPH